jgi:hypothetical protein
MTIIHIHSIASIPSIYHSSLITTLYNIQPYRDLLLRYTDNDSDRMDYSNLTQRLSPAWTKEQETVCPHLLPTYLILHLPHLIPISSFIT